MLITFELPDEDVRELRAAGIDPARRAKEALLTDLDQAREKQTDRVQPNLTGDFWKRLAPETHERFAATGISGKDFEAAAQGIRPLPKSKSDLKLAESIRELENTEPNMVLHLADIVFVPYGNEYVPTLRQFLPDELADKIAEEWQRDREDDPLAFRQRMQGWHQEKKALFHDLTSRDDGPGGEGKAFGKAREKSSRGKG